MLAPALIPTFDSGALFAATLAVHVLAGMCCVVSGAVAALSRKGAPRHRRGGQVYLIGLCTLVASMAVMVALRWEHHLQLLPIGLVAGGAGWVGYWNRRRGGADRIHIAAMGTSYLALLTGFYVDNGPHLPVWDLLPGWLFWLLPTVVGAPVVARAMRRTGTSSDRRPPVEAAQLASGADAT